MSKPLQIKTDDFTFTIVGLRSIIEAMVENKTTKVDLLNVDLNALQDILSWSHSHHSIMAIVNQLKDTAKAPGN